MRLTSIRWHRRILNCYNSFNRFTEERGIFNVGIMIHANIFSAFEERCAGGMYMARMDICIFQWAAESLKGLHVTTPFMSMLLD